MKTILTLILIYPLSLQAQDTIPVKASVILVKGVSFKEVVNQLLDRGYSMSKIDSNFNTLETDPYEPKYKTGLVHRMIVRARVKDSTAQFTATYGLGYNAQAADPVANFKMWRNSNKTPWYELNSFALSFNKPVEYLVQ